MEAGLKSGQKKVLTHLKNRKSVFGLMPTGYGKSRCFQVPAFYWGWRVVVVSPLISLMEDQVVSTQSRDGVFSIHSSMSREKVSIAEADLISGNWSLVYVSPERLIRWHGSGFLNRLKIDLLAIDEAHCVELWWEFREAYKHLSHVAKILKIQGATILAVSATMSAKSGRAFIKAIDKNARSVAMPLGRENLATYLLPCERYGEKYLILSSILSRLDKTESAIIYCASRDRTEELADILSAMGFSALAYHAGLPSEMRLRYVTGFRLGRIRIICATSAFGMGIDYGRVRTVVHFDLPESVESYWQEAGRAGRNLLPAVSAVLWTRSDLIRIRAMEAERKQKALQLIRLFLGEDCRKRLLEAHFGMRYRSPCGGCNYCLQVGNTVDDSLISGLQEFLYRQVWWLTPEADPAAWIPRFMDSSGAPQDYAQQ